MLTCPQCKKTLPRLLRQCPSCVADLTLLVDYVENLQQSLDQANELARKGDLGGAVWAYLQVLEVDPENAVARRQVSQVATAVRSFDRSAKERGLRRWLGGREPWWKSGKLWLAIGVILLAAAFFVGYHLGGEEDLFDF